ncbi:MAG: hypothetical protein EOO77_47395 [Oxalobacteraceae bacterium]|nr:MAG: hypothetical protein EOO77_47395 [Oxalobacteraceae bacterium]
MSWNWLVDFNSATWEGRDLKFRTTIDSKEYIFVVRSSHLRNAAQRTGPEALAINLPLLRGALLTLATNAQSGQTLTLN